MIRLCGFHLSNYHNKVRIALLEKGVPHEEDASCRPSQKDDFIARSPLGKVPYLEVEGGRRLTESMAICEYLEDAYPQKPLLPKDSYERAKVRELVIYLEMHLELVVRRLYGQAYFGRGPVSEEVKAAAEKDLAKGVRGLKALAKFSPFIAGAELTIADCAAFVHLPLVTMTSKIVYGRDFLEPLPEVKDYLKMLKERPAFARVDEDRKAWQAQAAAAAKK